MKCSRASAIVFFATAVSSSQLRARQFFMAKSFLRSRFSIDLVDRDMALLFFWHDLRCRHYFGSVTCAKYKGPSFFSFIDRHCLCCASAIWVVSMESHRGLFRIMTLCPWNIWHTLLDIQEHHRCSVALYAALRGGTQIERMQHSADVSLISLHTSDWACRWIYIVSFVLLILTWVSLNVSRVGCTAPCWLLKENVGWNLAWRWVRAYASFTNECDLHWTFCLTYVSSLIYVVEWHIGGALGPPRLTGLPLLSRGWGCCDEWVFPTAVDDDKCLKGVGVIAENADFRLLLLMIMIWVRTRWCW
jgi:hypothetical protein